MRMPLQASCTNICCKHFSFIFTNYETRIFQTNHILNQHHMQLMASSQMMSLHSRQMILLRSKNAGSILDVLHMAYEACLFPGRFLAMKEVWAGMISQSDTRCLVFNTLLMIPSFLLIFNVSMVCVW